MDFEKSRNQKRGLEEMSQELLQNVNGLWRELTMKSKPRCNFVEEEISKLHGILNELHNQFSKGSNHVEK